MVAGRLIKEKKMFKNFLRDEAGMEMVEWALVAVLFAVAGSVAYGTISDGVNTALGQVVSNLNNPGAP